MEAEWLDGLDPKKLAGLADKGFRAPDLIGTVEGWRAWGVSTELPSFGLPPKLHSVTYCDYFWTPRQVSRASCNRGCSGSDSTDTPSETCSCGFYSAKTLEHLMGMGYHAYDAEALGMFHIVGQVANWGKVIEGTQGWRSELAYPVKLFVPFEAWPLAKRLGDAYGVEVALKNTLRADEP